MTNYENVWNEKGGFMDPQISTKITPRFRNVTQQNPMKQNIVNM